MFTIAALPVGQNFVPDYRVSASIIFTFILIMFEFYSQYWLLDRKIVYYASIGVVGFIYRMI